MKFKAWDGKQWRTDFILFSDGTPAHIEYKMPYGVERIEAVQWKVVRSTGLLDENGHNDIYEGDIICIDGTIVGNIYETKEIYTQSTDSIVATMEPESWSIFVEKATKRGCKYAK